MSAPWYREFYSSINQAENVTRSPVSFLFLLAHPFLVKFRLEGLVSVEIIHSEPNRAINQRATNHHNLQILGFIILLLLERLCKCFLDNIDLCILYHILGWWRKLKHFLRRRYLLHMTNAILFLWRTETKVLSQMKSLTKNQWRLLITWGYKNNYFLMKAAKTG